MIQYLIILLDDTSVSFCHYPNPKTVRRLMSLDTLKAGILYGMKENLNIQFVYPDYELPKEYLEAIDTVDHTDIRTTTFAKDAEVVVMDNFDALNDFSFKHQTAYVLRTDKITFFARYSELKNVLAQVGRFNVVLTDIETFTDADFNTYKDVLARLTEFVEAFYVDGTIPQLNLLTDRMMLTKMNNCGAGDASITLAPDGKFYTCPAFYLSNVGHDLGSLDGGLCIKNPQLYRLSHAPICRHCDAWQCKRCIWLNNKTTLELNTPSHEQCVISHLERNASRLLLMELRKHGNFLPEHESIEKVDYLDPFENKNNWEL